MLCKSAPLLDSKILYKRVKENRSIYEESWNKCSQEDSRSRISRVASCHSLETPHLLVIGYDIEKWPWILTPSPCMKVCCPCSPVAQEPMIWRVAISGGGSKKMALLDGTCGHSPLLDCHLQSDSSNRLQTLGSQFQIMLFSPKSVGMEIWSIINLHTDHHESPIWVCTRMVCPQDWWFPHQ